MDVFRVRLNCIDQYQAVPTKYDPQLRKDIRASELGKEPRVPVIRVFGSTETGQKVCAHIHGAFPYLYIEYDGSLLPNDVGAYIYRLHLSIDHALAVSYRRNAYDGKSKYVARITLVKGIPFYGFYVGYRFYLKIYMLNPLVMTRFSELLQQGVIMKRKFQPYEAHLQYLLQFMADYNLYGCGYIETQRVCFRAPVPRHEDNPGLPHLWHSQSVSNAFITDDADLPRASHCSIEVDICVQDILNRHEIKERSLHHDFIEKKHPLPPDVKLVHSMAGLWKDETKRRKRRMLGRTPGSSPFPPEALVSMSADPRNSQPPGWIHEEEYRDQIQNLIQQEHEQSDGSNVMFDTFVETNPLESTINTMLQSVEDLYPDKLDSALGIASQPFEDDENPTSSILVDDDRILSIELDDDDGVFPDDSDERKTHDGALLKNQAPGVRKLSDDNSTKRRKPLDQSVEKISESSSNQSVTPISPDLGNRLDKKDRHEGLPIGVHISCLRLAHRPRIPIPEVLLDVAKDQGLVSKAPQDVQNVQPKGAEKRSALPLTEGQEVKRRCVGFSSTLDIGQASTKEKRPTSCSEQPGNRMVSTTSQIKPVRSSKSKKASKGLENQVLKFPVVKNPNDPSTKLRLSQKTNSQQSESSQPTKHVTFDQSTSAEVTDQKSTPQTDKSDPDSSASSSTKREESRKTIDVGCIPRPHTQFFILEQSPPCVEEVLSTMESSYLPDVIYQDAFYSNEKDVPQRVREYAGQEFRLEGNTLPYLPDFDPIGESLANLGMKSALPYDADRDERIYKRLRQECSLRSWEIAEPPPRLEEVQTWWTANQKATKNSQDPVMRLHDPELKPYMSQIDAPTPRNKHGFKYSQKKKSTSVQHEAQYMSTMSLEVHVNTRGKLFPNPEEDEVQCIFWCSKSDENFATGDNASSSTHSGIIVLSEDGSMARRLQMQSPIPIEVVEEETELELMDRMIEIVRTHDPDILTGYEVHGSSWGYLIERARFKYDFNLCDEFSRMKSQSFGRFGKESDRWGFNTTSTIRVTGRHMINIWRAMRGELTLLQYTMENVVWHLLHRRIPHYPWHTLTEWYTGGKHRDLSKLLRYYLTRAKLDIEILEANELIPRTSEQARLLGVDFFSVFSRGSQFKVESIMFRIAKPENFILVSPDRKQVGGQNALECLPLVMEPQSAFYNSPLVVLDFQSLYPSVMIAYNYCYSTFLGRIVNWRGTNKMGFTDYQRQHRLLELLKDHINISPNGMMYCKADVRKSLLAKMLTEILETRVMVKSGMKQDKEDKTLQQLLNNRQLALKLLANVTYGYTSASFSGRMPCSEIADSIVQTGRETLERAIALIHSVEKWKAEVVYGDTDSLFIYLPGRTKDQAFDIGNEIAKAVTDMNPRPIKLKFEKVYHPCVLLAKKRYVGYKYESKDQVKPDFDAKGIETVRRDGTPAEQMIEEKALKILFETADLSRVKSYFQKQCEKIMRGAVSMQDFCFAREVKLGTYSDRGPPPPGALISTKKMLEDARAEPQYGERVPYVVVSGAPGARLIDRCVAPEELLSSPHLQLDSEYYISKNLIPPLERIFNLVGANIRQWYDEMPKVQRIHRVDPTTNDGKNPFAKKTLESYMKAAACLVCGSKTKTEGSSVCARCRRNAPASLIKLQTQLNREERKLADVTKICQSCAGLTPLDSVPCDSKDCPVFYTRMKQATRYRTEKSVVEPAVKQLLEGEIEIEELRW